MDFEEYETAIKVSKVLGISQRRVLNTTYLDLIKMLVEKNELNESIIESIEGFIEVYKR